MKFTMGCKVRDEKLKLTDMIEFTEGGRVERRIFVKDDDIYRAIDIDTMESVNIENSLYEHYAFYSKKKGFKIYKNVYLGVEENE